MIRIKYADMHFVFVRGFYDLPLEGTCMHDGKLHQFVIDPHDDNDEVDYYILTPMTRWERIKAKINQTAFEWCVGYHWTYTDSRRTTGFYYRSPQWFFKLLFSLYYWVTMRQWIRLGK